MSQENKFIDVTDNAVIEFAKKLDDRKTPQAMIRLGIKGGACQGMQYVIQFEDRQPGQHDVVWTKNGVKFVIDIKSFDLLKESRLIFKTKGLLQGFEFENPNEVSRCGCGKSFKINSGE